MPDLTPEELERFKQIMRDGYGVEDDDETARARFLHIAQFVYAVKYGEYPLCTKIKRI